MKKNNNTLLIKSVLVFVLYARASVILFFFSIIAVTFLPKAGIFLIYNFFVLLVPAFIIILVSFLPKCPYCDGSILVTSIKGRHSDLKRPNGFWRRWFGEIIDILKNSELPCVRCGKVTLI